MRPYKARDAKDQRRIEAEARQKHYDKLSIPDKLKDLGEFGSTKQRIKLLAKLS